MPVQTPFLSPDLQEEDLAVQRKRRIADALLGQGMTQQKGQMIGNLYLPPNALQNVISGVGGTLLGKKLDKKEKDITAEGQQRQSSDLQRIADALKGRQATPGGLVEDASGNVTQQDPTSAQTPQQALQAILPGMQSPLGQNLMQGYLGGQIAQATPPKPTPFTLKPGERRYGADGRMIVEGALEKPVDANGYTLAPGARRLGPNGEVIAENPRSASQTPYFSPQQTPQGIMAFDARTGTMRLAPVQGQPGPAVGAANDPRLQRELASAKAGGKELGEETAKAQLDLPRVVANASNAIQLVDQMIGSENGQVPPHPGFQSSVGLGVGPLTKHISGSDSANFHALLDQVKGGAFLEAFNSLKGGGQITEVEGKKATDAITRMQTAQSEKEFVKAAREYQSIIRLGVERAQGKAGVSNDRRSAPRSGSTKVVDY